MTGMQLHESLPDHRLLCDVGPSPAQSHITLWVEHCARPAPVIGTHALTAHLDAGRNVLPLTQHFSRRLLQWRQHNQAGINNAVLHGSAYQPSRTVEARGKSTHCAWSSGQAPDNCWAG